MDAVSSVWAPGSSCSLLDEWKLRFPLSFVCVSVHVCVCARTEHKSLPVWKPGSASYISLQLWELFPLCNGHVCIPNTEAQIHLTCWSEELTQHRCKRLGMKAHPSYRLALCKGKRGTSGLFWAKPSPTINISVPAWIVKRPWRKCYKSLQLQHFGVCSRLTGWRKNRRPRGAFFLGRSVCGLWPGLVLSAVSFLRLVV